MALSFSEQRAERLARHLHSRGIHNARVLGAMAKVPRHEFVSADLQVEAYADRPLPIGLGQTISQPYVVASMTQHLDLPENARILEIGTGCGYQTAILAELGQDVYSLEILPELQKDAQVRLERLGYQNIHFRTGDGRLGWSDAAPFDAILVAAASRDIPPALVKQLKAGGKMILPLEAVNGEQTLVLMQKDLLGKTQQSPLYNVRFVPLKHATS